MWPFTTKHKWVYHNPYNRVCSVCDRREVSMCRSMDTWNDAWWETFREGDAAKHKRKWRS